MIDEALVLAGGFGTRLQTVVRDLPKPMAPVRGKPFLAYVLDYLKYQSIRRVILSVGYKKETIQNCFGLRYGGLELIYSPEDTPLGTGGAIEAAMPMIQSQAFTVINGDTFFPIDLSLLSRLHMEKTADVSMALKEMSDFDRYGTVVCGTDGRITDFREKMRMASGLINGGIYILQTDALAGAGLAAPFSFEKDFLEKQVNRKRLYGLAFRDYFIDIGIPEDYTRAQIELKDTANA